MSKRYGLPYMSSKNAIAAQIVEMLPEAENFYDLFAGGCAVTHAALESGKYKNIYINDINGAITQLFLNAINGKYKNEKRWISRADFFEQKEKDLYIKYCWSFGNKGNEYLYSREIEPWKKALHYAYIFNDYSHFEEMGVFFELYAKQNLRKALIDNPAPYLAQYQEWYCQTNFNCTFSAALKQQNKEFQTMQNWENLKSKKELEYFARTDHLQRLKRLQNLENLIRVQNLQSLKGHVTRYCASYDKIKIKPNSIIYCDIPYRDTEPYSGAPPFDHAAFYAWAHQQKELVIISEYNMPTKPAKSEE